MPRLSSPLLDLCDPVHYQGNTPESKASSLSGAEYALVSRKAKTDDYKRALRLHGKLTDHQAAAILNVGLSSINSIRNGLNERAEEAGLPAAVVADGVQTLPRGGHKRLTQRTYWKLR